MDVSEEVPMINAHAKLTSKESINKLHNLMYKLEEDNDLPHSKLENKLNNNNDISESTFGDVCLLENVQDVAEMECDTDLDSESSWLYESPNKVQTPGKNRDSNTWLKENVSTPDLLRIRGSLSAKLDVIAIENRRARRHSLEPRKISRSNKYGDFGSVNSLDWDFDATRLSLKLSTIKPNDEMSFGQEANFHPSNEYNDSDLESSQGLPSNIASQMLRYGKDRQAWIDQSNNHYEKQDKPFKLDWSEDEDDLEPMSINFSSSPQQTVPRIVRRSAPVQPSGLVLSNRSQARELDNQMMHDEIDAEYHNEFSASAPVIPRGTAKRGFNILSHSYSFGEIDTIPEQPWAQRCKNSPVQRGSNILKPVQRRKAETNDANTIRPRGSANHLKVKNSSMQKSHSASDVNTDSLKVNIPASVDGQVVRRRGAPVAELSATPRKALGSSPVARTQGIPQVRRSTGSIPQKRGDNIARPRQSTGAVARPRGHALAQSWQGD